MRITFRQDSTFGEGSFTRVRRGGRRLGKIFHAGRTPWGTSGVHRFYEGDQVKLGGPDLADADLERLKALIREKYGDHR